MIFRRNGRDFQPTEFDSAWKLGEPSVESFWLTDRNCQSWPQRSQILIA